MGITTDFIALEDTEHIALERSLPTGSDGADMHEGQA